LVFCKVDDRVVYYQVTDAITTEEGFEKHNQGFHIVEALQIGTLDFNRGCIKFPWLPQMNSPVFIADPSLKLEQNIKDNEFSLGHIPGTQVDVVGNIENLILYHTAILGVTGTGKTEFAFDLVRKAISQGAKVLCVDITGDYCLRLKQIGLDFTDISLSEGVCRELSEKLFGVEVGTYGAPKEKVELHAFKEKIKGEITTSLKGFLENGTNLGLLHLPAIHNTKATIHITELYLSEVFSYAKLHRDKQKVLIVLEEAHTVIPESQTMGVTDNDSRGIISKISQIALQGRKYGVGLLVIAQRTATVSKTILTQCNTVIAFSSFDQTGLDFLSNFYGRSYTSRIPNLQFLSALVFGKGVKSQRPVVIALPYKQILPVSETNEATVSKV